MQYKIAIVGASISGLSYALQLRNLGYDVTIFEKSSNDFTDRGAGIGLPQDLIQTLIQENFIDANFKTIKITDSKIYRVKDGKRLLITESELNFSSINWGELYRSLKKRVSDFNVHYNSEVTGIKNYSKYVELTFKNNNTLSFDYVIFADGYNSFGRNFLYPELKLNYAGYITWRGLAMISPEEYQKMFGHQFNYGWSLYLYPKGHFLLYPIVHNDQQNPDHYLFNWLLHEKIDNNHPLFKNDQTYPPNNIAPGFMTTKQLQFLINLANEYLPTFAANIIQKTEKPFMQIINDLLVPSNIVDHICLVGDAATLLRPHAGSGAAKSLQGALALGNYIRQYNDLNQALMNWNINQIERDRELFNLSRDLGNLFVTNVPDLNSLDKKTFDRLWKEVTSKYNWYMVNKK